MNTKQAKRIKRAIFGDYSHRLRKYVRVIKTGVILNHPDSLRAKYQAAKRAYLARMRKSV